MVSAEVIPLVSAERARLEAARRDPRLARWYAALDDVRDPEVPVLSIYQLGVLQAVSVEGDAVTVTITPTYSGCPAMERIRDDIEKRLRSAGAAEVVVDLRLTPPWSTDWLDRNARRALHDYGVAPPESTACPQCGSKRTELVSEFGSTACKALYRCLACQEPFDHFKQF